MNRKYGLALLGLLVAACSIETEPRTIHATGEYGLFRESMLSSRKKYLFRECGSGDEYTLSFDSEAMGHLIGKILAAGAKPDETILVELEASSSADALHVFRVSKIYNVRWGECDD